MTQKRKISEEHLERLRHNRELITRCDKCGTFVSKNKISEHQCIDHEYMKDPSLVKRKMESKSRSLKEGRWIPAKPWLGKNRSEVTKKKISDTKKKQYESGEIVPYAKKGMVLNTGRTWFKPKDERITGINNHNWKGGISPDIKKRWSSIEYRKWRKYIYERDNYTCQICEQSGGKLNAHHIKPIKSNPEFIFNIDNGVTLCETCHRQLHKEMSNNDKKISTRQDCRNRRNRDARGRSVS
jgi:hypothetical protein